MSRLGKKPVEILKGVKADISTGVLSVEGPKGRLTYDLPENIFCREKEGKLYFTSAERSKTTRALHGTARARAANMIIGVSSGFAKVLLIEGVGYKAQNQGKFLRLDVGFSHHVQYAIPEGVKIDASKQVEIAISGIDKQQVGQVAAEIRAVCPPEPYKGKGIRYSDEHIRRKVGKAVTK